MRTVAVIKIGTTTSVMLAGADLTTACLRRQRLANLLGSDRSETLARVLADFSRELAGIPGRRPLVAGGEAFRLHPELAAVAARQGFPVWTLTPEQEGGLCYAAVKAVKPDTRLVVDLGGGSTELATADAVWSLPLGAARSASPEHAAIAAAGAQRPVWVGGTAVLTARLLGTRSVSLQALRHLAQSLPAALPPDLDPLRRELYPHGLGLMIALAARYEWQNLAICERGLSEGLWLAACLGRGTP
ncbi:MAG: hypothetical protein M0Z53_04105 [Thermaerobacter sp.]|nr:hypothetical protein [Thermaerobacter sp.]